MTEYTTLDDLCRTDDEYIRHRPRWVACLSSGEVIFQDDDRPSVSESSAWIRLKRYCEGRGLHIVEFWLQFRSNRVRVEPKDADGYYFVKCVFGVWGEGITYDAFVAGALVDGRIRGLKWKVPELLPFEEIDRDPAEKPLLLISRVDKSEHGNYNELGDVA